jgi:hypothetical protein
MDWGIADKAGSAAMLVSRAAKPIATLHEPPIRRSISSLLQAHSQQMKKPPEGGRG